MCFTRIRKCHCGFRHARFQAWKGFEFKYNRGLNHSGLETGIHNISVRINTVLESRESSCPIKKILTIKYLQVIAGVKGEWRLKICSFSVWCVVWWIPFGCFEDDVSLLRFGTSCLCCDLVASELSSVMDGSTWLEGIISNMQLSTN